MCVVVEEELCDDERKSIYIIKNKNIHKMRGETFLSGGEGWGRGERKIKFLREKYN